MTGIAIRYGLVDAARFSAPVQIGPPSFLYNGYRVSLSGSKAVSLCGGKTAEAWR